MVNFALESLFGNQIKVPHIGAKDQSQSSVHPSKSIGSAHFLRAFCELYAAQQPAQPHIPIECLPIAKPSYCGNHLNAPVPEHR